MIHTTLIDTAVLASHLDDPDWAVVDCRYSLEDPDRGELSYLAGHVPAAVYVHIDRNLSGPVVPGRTGRHPLPDVGSVEESFGAWGIGPGVRIDNMGNPTVWRSRTVSWRRWGADRGADCQIPAPAQHAFTKPANAHTRPATIGGATQVALLPVMQTGYPSNRTP